MISTETATKENVEVARELMLDFAHRTGLSSGEAPRRYLWTDAFAVCNFLGLARATGESSLTTLALRLIEQVHQILGRTRPGEGWLSGLGEREGAAHPTAGGLRIGKKLPERRPDEPFDERLEWDRDGQYFHYLTRWTHALDQAARATGAARFNLWARELAQTAHRAFCYGPTGGRRMVWKMSTDLSRPLVHAMGQHDALDGLVTALALQSTARDFGGDSAAPEMGELIADFGAIVEGQDLVTTDPLGLGGLLSDAARVAQLAPPAGTDGGALVELLLEAALQGLPFYAQEGELRRGASGRLAFRELGLAIGLHALDRVPESAVLDALATYAPLAARIDSFWRAPAHRRAPGYDDHRDINDVMLATSLAPAGFVVRVRVAGADPTP